MLLVHVESLEHRVYGQPEEFCPRELTAWEQRMREQSCCMKGEKVSTPLDQDGRGPRA